MHAPLPQISRRCCICAVQTERKREIIGKWYDKINKRQEKVDEIIGQQKGDNWKEEKCTKYKNELREYKRKRGIKIKEKEVTKGPSIKKRKRVSNLKGAKGNNIKDKRGTKKGSGEAKHIMHYIHKYVKTKNISIISLWVFFFSDAWTFST